MSSAAAALPPSSQPEEEEKEVPEEVLNPDKKVVKWSPKKWRPVYEVMVGLHVMGFSNKDIAERTGYTPQQVCNIVNSKQAAVIIKIITERIRQGTFDVVEKTTKPMQERITDLQEKALERVEDVIGNDEIFEKAPFHMIDRSIKLLQATRIIGDENKNSNVNVNVNVNGGASTTPDGTPMPQLEELKRIRKGLEKLADIEAIHGEPIRIIDNKNKDRKNGSGVVSITERGTDREESSESTGDTEPVE